MTKEKAITDKRRFYLNEWADEDERLAETKEAIMALVNTGRKFPWTISLLLEQIQSLAISREEALEKLADFDIETEESALRAWAETEGGDRK